MERRLEQPLYNGLPDRRRGRKARHPVYVAILFMVMGVGLLALLALPGLTIVAALYPGLSGPAYLALVNINIVLLGVVVMYMLRKVLLMFLERRGRLRGGRLHVRLLGIFGLLAVVPTMFVALMAVYLLNMGIEGWFNQKVNRALEGSLLVAEAYLDEHERGVALEVQAMAQDSIWRERPWLFDSQELKPWLRAQVERRRLDEVAVVDDNGVIINQSGMFGGIPLSPEMLGALRAPMARAGTFRTLPDGRVVALAPVREGVWLVAQRWVNSAVLARVDQTNAAFKEYAALKSEQGYVRWLVTLFMLLMTSVVTAGAIWMGIRLANKIVRPVTHLVHATNRVSAGQLDVRLTPSDDDELGVLTQAFNRMTQQLHNQRDLVERKNRELDDRRKQMEAVLTGVTAAVLSVSAAGVVKSANQTAQHLLNVRAGGRLDKSLPAMAEVWARFVEHPKPVGQQQVKVEVEGDVKTLMVRLVPQYVEGGKVGSVVVTADDITPLIGAQRLAAWRDVARRLAHEIKNPLTPIKLSAERLQRKYLKVMPEGDQKLFKELTDTIVQQAEDMRRMTNEFSDFARMPMAVFTEENLLELVGHAVVLQKTGRADIKFETQYELTPEEATLWCDRGQVNRVLVNIVENAVNAIEESGGEPGKEEGKTSKGEKSGQGLVTVVVKKTHDDKVRLTVLDNGKGLPPDVEVNKLFDPYVTTRKRGTGLGLAIVKKVMDEHEGTVKLMRRAEGGTMVELTFPRKPSAPQEKEILPHEPEPAAG